jgi:hypothetical protein
MTPFRQRKHDRLITPGASANEIAADFAAAPFDKAMRDAERTWGIERLPELVAPATAAKFGKAMAVLNDALTNGSADAAAAAALNCVKGIAVMEAEARAAGHQPISPDAWECEYEGHRFLLIRDSAEWPAVAAQRPGMAIYSLREVAVALHAHKNALGAVKAAFPGAELSAIRKPAPSPLSEELEDEIPW